MQTSEHYKLWGVGSSVLFTLPGWLSEEWCETLKGNTMSHSKLCTVQNAKRGYYPSKAAGSVHFKWLKAAGRRCPSMEEVWPMLKEFMDSWALYFQKEKGTAVACFDTFD